MTIRYFGWRISGLLQSLRRILFCVAGVCIVPTPAEAQSIFDIFRGGRSSSG